MAEVIYNAPTASSWLEFLTISTKIPEINAMVRNFDLHNPGARALDIIGTNNIAEAGNQQARTIVNLVTVIDSITLTGCSILLHWPLDAGSRVLSWV